MNEQQILKLIEEMNLEHRKNSILRIGTFDNITLDFYDVINYEPEQKTLKIIGGDDGIDIKHLPIEKVTMIAWFDCADSYCASYFLDGKNKQWWIKKCNVEFDCEVVVYESEIDNDKLVIFKEKNGDKIKFVNCIVTKKVSIISNIWDGFRRLFDWRKHA